MVVQIKRITWARILLQVQISCLTQTCIDGECYAATGATANVTFNLFETTKTLYKTCKFYLEPSSSSDEVTVGLFETFKMKNQAGWFAYTSAINKDSSIIATILVGSNTQTLYTASTDVTLYIRDVVISTVPLYNRPVLNTIERNTYNQLQPDGIIHLASTYLNHVTTTFAWFARTISCIKTSWAKPSAGQLRAIMSAMATR